jgi:pimeloyl-ACP methyl ester carboxylesterase
MHGVRCLGPVVAVALSIVVSAVPAIATAHAAGSDATLDWELCRGGTAECATLAVPLDDTVADSATIDVALLRVPARDPERRIGSLLVNPGGPGAPGRDFAAGLAGSLPDVLQDRFDIVGFDPRGTGKTIPVECTDELDPLYATDWDPDTADERTTLEDANRAFVESCVRLSGDRLQFVSSQRTVRDMERIRVALGDEQLTYLGFSYGSYLGALYAAQHPDRVRALALDGAVDPSLDALTFQVQQAVGFEHSLQLFLDDCTRSGECEFADGADPGEVYDGLRARTDATPINALDDRVLNETLFDIGVTELLYDGKSGWGTLDSALASAKAGDGSDLVSYADLYTGRSDDGTYDNLQAAFTAIGCADGPPVGAIDELGAIEEAAVAYAPRVGATIINNSMACAFWPLPGAPPAVVSAPDSEPILVLGTHDDPATPVVWARGLADQLGSGVLVTAGGAQHTAFGMGNACVDRIVVRYLAHGATPKDGKRC